MNINNMGAYISCCKKIYEVQLRYPALGEKVFNKLEKSSYTTDANKPFVLVGTVGEEWVIDLKKLCTTYSMLDGSPITTEILDGVKGTGLLKIKTRPVKGSNWALHVPVPEVCKIDTSWGDILTVNAPDLEHGEGDFIVCADENGRPNLKDRWVVSGKIFGLTYSVCNSLRSVKGMDIFDENG